MGWVGKIVLVAALVTGTAASGADWRAQQQAEIAEVHLAVEKYRDFRAARADGWRPGPVAPLMGAHWSRRGSKLPVAGDPLDLSQPGNLIYAEVDGQTELIGVAYIVRLGDFDPLPEGFAGPEDVWHVHNVDLILGAVSETHPVIGWFGRKWIRNTLAPDGRSRLAMVHVWLDGRSPDGVFADRDRSLPYRELGLDPDLWVDAPIEAGFGLALARSNGCDEELDGKLWLSGANWVTRGRARRACREAAAHVRGALGGPREVLNAEAMWAWLSLEARLEKILSADEKARITRLVETSCAKP